MDRDHPQAGSVTATPEPLAIRSQADLIAYARKHRYRIRNLHDGGPVPPAMPSKGLRRSIGYTSELDRWDAIVGRQGYVGMDGNRLTVCLFYRSSQGVAVATASLQAMGGRIEQVGDTEVSAMVLPERIEEVLKLIKVSKRRPGDVLRFRAHTEAASGTETVLETSE